MCSVPAPRILHQRRSMDIHCTSAGRLDCVVCWMEYDLLPQSLTQGRCDQHAGEHVPDCASITLSFAPEGLRGEVTQPYRSSHTSDAASMNAVGNLKMDTKAASDDLPATANSGMAVRPDPALRPHVWQRVHYLTMRPLVSPTASQAAFSEVTFDLSLDGDEMRIEIDETRLGSDLKGSGGGSPSPSDDDLNLHLAPGSELGHRSDSSRSSDNAGRSASPDSGGGCPSSSGVVGRGLDGKTEVEGEGRDGEKGPDWSDSSWRPQQQRERENAGQHQGLEGYPREGGDAYEAAGDRGQEGGRFPRASEVGTLASSASQDPGAVRGHLEPVDGGVNGALQNGRTDNHASHLSPPLQPMSILPYHMSMLNDRDRTRRYRAGIKGAGLVHALLS